MIYKTPVSTLDLFPTFMAAAGSLPPTAVDGVNLLPYLTGSSIQPDRYLYWAGKSKSAIRRGVWKLKTGVPVELYNLATDISEKSNVAAANPLIVNELNWARRAWIAKLPPPQ